MPSQETIRNISILHKEALRVARELDHQEFLMIEILQKIDHQKIYRHLGFTSLFQYAVHGLKLSENRAYNFIVVSRKAASIDRFQQALKSGELNLSRARRLSSVVTEANTEEWIKIAKTLSHRGLKKAVAKENPRSLVQEGTHFISENTLELRSALDTDADKWLRRVQDLLSQSLGRPATFGETIKEMARFYVEKKDPVVKAARCLRKNAKGEAKKTNLAKHQVIQNANLAQRQVVSQAKREPIISSLKHQVNLRDQGKCQREGCTDSRWVDHHHVIPVNQGGKNTLENLMTLCRSHHQMEHALGTTKDKINLTGRSIFANSGGQGTSG